MLKGVEGFTKDIGLTARAVKPPLEDVLIRFSWDHGRQSAEGASEPLLL